MLIFKTLSKKHNILIAMHLVGEKMRKDNKMLKILETDLNHGQWRACHKVQERSYQIRHELSWKQWKLFVRGSYLGLPWKQKPEFKFGTKYRLSSQNILAEKIPHNGQVKMRLLHVMELNCHVTHGLCLSVVLSCIL